MRVARIFYGAILLLHTPAPHLCLTRASWSFKAGLNVLQTNAVSFLAPCLPTSSRSLKTQFLRLRGVAAFGTLRTHLLVVLLETFLWENPARHRVSLALPGHGPDLVVASLTLPRPVQPRPPPRSHLLCVPVAVELEALLGRCKIEVWVRLVAHDFLPVHPHARWDMVTLSNAWLAVPPPQRPDPSRAMAPYGCSPEPRGARRVLRCEDPGTGRADKRQLQRNLYSIPDYSGPLQQGLPPHPPLPPPRLRPLRRRRLCAPSPSPLPAPHVRLSDSGGRERHRPSRSLPTRSP